MTYGFDYDPHVVMTDLARLLAYVASSETLARRASTDRDAYFPIAELRKAEVIDVHRILVSTAVLLRERIEFTAERETRYVGSLFEGEGPEVALSIREACNKIIHADRVNEERGPDLSTPHKGQPSVVGGLTGVVVLSGKKGRIDWRAELDVFSFCFAAYWAL